MVLTIVPPMPGGVIRETGAARDLIQPPKERRTGGENFCGGEPLSWRLKASGRQRLPGIFLRAAQKFPRIRLLQHSPQQSPLKDQAENSASSGGRKAYSAPVSFGAPSSPARYSRLSHGTAAGQPPRGTDQQ